VVDASHQLLEVRDVARDDAQQVRVLAGDVQALGHFRQHFEPGEQAGLVGLRRRHRDHRQYTVAERGDIDRGSVARHHMGLFESLQPFGDRWQRQTHLGGQRLQRDSPVTLHGGEDFPGFRVEFHDFQAGCRFSLNCEAWAASFP